MTMTEYDDDDGKWRRWRKMTTSKTKNDDRETWVRITLTFFQFASQIGMNRICFLGRRRQFVGSNEFHARDLDFKGRARAYRQFITKRVHPVITKRSCRTIIYHKIIRLNSTCHPEGDPTEESTITGRSCRTTCYLKKTSQNKKIITGWSHKLTRIMACHHEKGQKRKSGVLPTFINGNEIGQINEINGALEKTRTWGTEKGD